MVRPRSNLNLSITIIKTMTEVNLILSNKILPLSPIKNYKINAHNLGIV